MSNLRNKATKRARARGSRLGLACAPPQRTRRGGHQKLIVITSFLNRAFHSAEPAPEACPESGHVMIMAARAASSLAPQWHVSVRGLFREDGCVCTPRGVEDPCMRQMARVCVRCLLAHRLAEPRSFQLGQPRVRVDA
eukprot:10163874-Alexandrium_andersonii.AAC.1